MIALFVLLACIPTAMLRAWAVSKLWNWFLVSGLGLPALQFKTAMGMMLIVGFILTRDDDKKKVTAEKIISALFRSVSLSLFMVGFGWLYLELF